MDVNFNFDNEQPSLTGSRMLGKIVSPTAYLLGIDESRFEEEGHELDPAIIPEMDKDKNAKIFRALCILRTRCERDYYRIVQTILNEHTSITRLPDEMMPKKYIDYLYQEGIDLYKVNTKVEQFIMTLNSEINRRVHMMKKYYPAWVNWEYIKDIFIMPGGTDYQGIKDAATEYYQKQLFCPYRCYMNFRGEEHEGNILTNDIRFLNTIYKWHGEEFTDLSKVQDADLLSKQGISMFIQESEHTIAVVDCENASPYSFYSMLKGLQGEQTGKISKIILISDERASSAWKIFEDFTDITVDYVVLQRIKENKSLVDMTVSARVCKEFYKGNADRFLLVSSDSDYWALIGSLPEAKFLVVLEHAKCGQQFIDTLWQNGIQYCYSDIFNSTEAEGLKQKALLKEIKALLPDFTGVNLNDLLEKANQTTYADLNDSEKKEFYKKKLSKIRLDVSKNGDLSICFN